MQQRRLVFSLLTAPLILLGNTSCGAIHYSFAPADTITLAAPISNHSAISFRIFNLSAFYPYPKSNHVQLLEALQKEFVNPMAFQAARPVDEIPETGLFVSVDPTIHTMKSSPGRRLNMAFSTLTLFAIPYYGELGYGTRSSSSFTFTSMVITYTLYVDGAWKKEYPYPVRMKEFLWILAPLVFPFLSSNWDTPFSGATCAQELLTSTARQFLRDAQRDGLLWEKEQGHSTFLGGQTN